LGLKALKTNIGKMVGRGLIFGPAILLLETFGSDIIVSLLTEMSDGFNLNLTESQKKAIADTAINAIDTGLLLSIFFGKKGFKAGIIGSLLTGAIKHITGLPEEFWTKNFDFAGMETPFTNEMVLMAGSLLAGYFGPSLLMGAISQGFGGKPAFAGANVGRDARGRFTKLKPELQTSFRTRFISRLGPAFIISAVGGAMADFIRSEFGDTAGDAASWTVNGMAIGYTLGGPIGALLGGITFLAASGLKAMGDYLREQDTKLRNKIVSEADDILARQAAGEDVDPEEVAAKTSAAASELMRFADPTGGLIHGAGNEEALHKAYQMNVKTLEERGRMGQAYRERAAYALASGDYAEAVRAAAISLKEYDREVTPEAVDMELIYARAEAQKYGGLKQGAIDSLLASKGELTSDSLSRILSSSTKASPISSTAKPTNTIDPGFMSALNNNQVSAPPIVAGQIGDTVVSSTAFNNLPQGPVMAFDPNGMLWQSP
jgi:hypothetical protein